MDTDEMDHFLVGLMNVASGIGANYGVWLPWPICLISSFSNFKNYWRILSFGIKYCQFMFYTFKFALLFITNHVANNKTSLKLIL